MTGRTQKSTELLCEFADRRINAAVRIGEVCSRASSASTASSRQQTESGDISADGTLILEGLGLLARVSRLSELQRALWKKRDKTK